MQLTFLGTSCMVPTKERNVAGLFLSYKDEGILFDCGEGTQRQMNITGINRNKVTKILVSHWHGDHVSGLVGLIQTLGNSESPVKIDLFGPKGTKEYVSHLQRMCVFDTKIDLRVHELDPKGLERFFETKDYALECAYLDHTTPTLGYSFIEKDRRRINVAYLRSQDIPDGPHLQKLTDGKNITFKGKKIDVDKATYEVQGKKVTVISDTVLCNNCVVLAEEADVVVCESAYASNLSDKARKYKHMTAREAGMVANQANAKKLVLTHFSQRYKNTMECEDDARNVFDNVVCAEDFMKIKL